MHAKQKHWKWNKKKQQQQQKYSTQQNVESIFIDINKWIKNIYIIDI